jgi:hypothetical protein
VNKLEICQFGMVVLINMKLSELAALAVVSDLSSDITFEIGRDGPNTRLSDLKLYPTYVEDKKKKDYTLPIKNMRPKNMRDRNQNLMRRKY